MAETHVREFSELPITVDRNADTPLPAQIAAAIREAINQDALRPGEAVPATRELASRIGVARGVVVAAYAQLLSEGYLSAGHGRGTRVHPELRSITELDAHRTNRGSTAGSASAQELSNAADAPASRLLEFPITGAELHTPAPTSSSLLEIPITEENGTTPPNASAAEAALPLAPGLPDTSAVKTAAWRAAWRSAASQSLFEAPDLGDPRLRKEIAEHLRRMRGTTRPASDIIVTAGAREGLSLLLSALGTTRGRALTVGVEDPGYPSLRRVASRHGAQIIALPVDAEGLVTEQLPETLLDVVLVTPSHQYPLGGSLPLTRRRELLDWAARTGAVIIEDDYDSELRHTGSPLPTLAALDNAQHGSVALLGTFSKTISQAVSSGFLLVPENLRRIIEPARQDLGGPVSAVVQSALAEYLASGELRRHTARMRRRYAARRELVVERLFGTPGVQVRPMSGGLHAVIEFQRGSQNAEQSVLARSAHLGVVPLSAYWHGLSSGSELFGLVIGTGGSLDEEHFDGALRELRQILAEELSA
ncbi:PLP-dependent aminotransferase family protein [Leucobacter sp. UT-8R-CII-1-4]|uniref:MocR-like pyridoxine biosynthesis transcription factor PdxR n=1 Tax=Leucobacter sp. UT-8R-CII-1-4 TaxID=3040075 RepID=UPI0024A98AEC|nr:PLP-dependent aminotransferase family protein [Leucobacter sp. UT-8R-CII-1-4]MDI6023337.1 PLP-dependent aminotransferase family protein [Leucobacter sp. UT-8R-CII-1-4]